ncbi:MAG: Fe-S cluster assembly protein SufD [Acidobacteriota bacterium]|nr:Fe-S cluster assembly protein SufD [Acidobacteriota bacterium]
MIEVMEQTELYLGAEITRGPAWSTERRQSARKRFRELGVPHGRQESWRFTNPRKITALEAVPAAAEGVANLTAERVAEYLLPDTAWSLVFDNGIFRADLSSRDGMPEGVHIEPLASGEPAELGDIENSHAFTTLNDAMWTDGVSVRVDDGVVVEGLIQFIFTGDGDGGTPAVHTRNLIKLGAGAKLNLVESYRGRGVYWTNAVTDVDLGENAELTHFFQQLESEQACHTSRFRVTQSPASTLNTHNLLIGGDLARRDIDIALVGEGAHAGIDGLYVVHDTQLSDMHITVDHAVPECTSEQYIKGILDNKSRGVFCGRVIVAQDAQKTDARQTNRNLLLSDDAHVNTMPQLEIYADDVKCAHGATTGQLDRDALFYLQSRGVDEVAARDLLLFAFANELIDRLPSEGIREHAEAFLEHRFHSARQLGE